MKYAMIHYSHRSLLLLVRNCFHNIFLDTTFSLSSRNALLVTGRAVPYGTGHGVSNKCTSVFKKRTSFN